MTERIALSRIHYPVTALGPGRRIGIWTQGCTIRCPGCISADTWARRPPTVSLDQAMRLVDPWLAQAAGITISGGEPFDQPRALLGLLERIRDRFDGDILVYTGYRRRSIASWLRRAEGLIDALISGPYRADLPQTLPVRGSDNQELDLLTPLGRQRFGGLLEPDQTTRPALDVMFDEDGTVWLAGIPRRGSLEDVSTALAAAGQQIVTSQDRRAGADPVAGERGQVGEA